MPQTQHSPVRIHRWLLLVIVLAGFVLRVIYNSYELPPVYAYPNEFDKRNNTLNLPKDGWDHGISMPSLLYNTTFLIYIPARWVYNWGHVNCPSFKPFAIDLMDYYLWVGRVYMGVCGAIGIWLIYHLGKRLGSRRIGLIAAALLAVAPIQVIGSRHMKEDMPLGLVCTGAMIVMLDLMRRRAVRDYFRCAFMVGLCLSTKWLGFVTAVPFALAHFFAWRRHPQMQTRKNPIWWTALILGGFLAGFFIASPDYLMRVGDLKDGFRRGIEKSYSTHSDGMKVHMSEEALTDYWRTGLWPGLTPALLGLGIGGWFWLYRRRRDDAILIGFWIVFFTFLLESAKARPYPHYQRYIQPVIPCMVALAACGVEGLRKLVMNLGRGRLKSVRYAATGATIFLTIAAAAWPLHDSLRYLNDIPQSTVTRAYEFLNANVPANSLILVDDYGPLIDRVKYRRLRFREKDQLNFAAFPTEPCYVLYSNQGMGRYLEHRDADEELTRFVYYVLGTGKLVQEWKPGFRSFYGLNPAVQLYYFDGHETRFVPKPAPKPKKSKHKKTGNNK